MLRNSGFHRVLSIFELYILHAVDCYRYNDVRHPSCVYGIDIVEVISLLSEHIPNGLFSGSKQMPFTLMVRRFGYRVLPTLHLMAVE